MPTSASWHPKISFLRSGRLTIFVDELKQDVTFKWAFKHIRMINTPLVTICCTFTGLDMTVTGLGDGFMMKTALSRALAEAWERWWMIAITSRKFNHPYHFVTSSNGFAAGKTNREASDSSKKELIERHIFLLAWKERKGWKPLNLRAVFSKWFCLILERKGWRCTFFKINHRRLGSILAGLARHTKFGAVFDCAFCETHEVSRQAEMKLVFSLIRNAAFRENRQYGKEWQFPERGVPQDHDKFYGNPEHLSAFEFMDYGDSQRGVLESNDEDFKKIKTVLLYDADELPAVAFSSHESWLDLGWGKESIKGKNPWPHPLA